MQYDPLRQKNPRATHDPLEIELVYAVRPCWTCEFFWPERSPQPYGPYPAYDFTSNTPAEKEPGIRLSGFKGRHAHRHFPTPKSWTAVAKRRS